MSGAGSRDRPAAWWSASLRSRPILDLLKGWSGPVGWATAAASFSGCAELLAETPDDEAQAALDQQQESGWNVGGEGQPMLFPGAQALDISGSTRWRDMMSTLALRLAPTGARWAPYYNPTLFQSLEAPRNAELQAIMRPIFTPEMALASRRGEALLSLLVENGACRNDVAVVLDLAGPESVAAAAALGACFDPVFVFANWPHPLGVVPAHHTLGAALYFLPAFARHRTGRPPTAPPVFVLDRRRLSPYADDSGQFDNRYLAGLPPIGDLRAAGIEHLLYVTPDDGVMLEMDDLNEDLVAIDQGGVDVKMLALSDFAAAPLPEWPAVSGCLPSPSPPLSPSPSPPSALAGPPAAPRLFFGGSPQAQSCFPFWYGWRRDPPPLATGIPSAGTPASSQSLAAMHGSIPIPPRLTPRCRFHPAPRATFAIAGRASGSIVGWHGNSNASGIGGGFHRSGSMGRMHSGGFG